MIRKHLLNKFYNSRNHRSYSEIMDDLGIGKNAENRRYFFSKLDLKNKRVLEVGVGSGYNFQYYNEVDFLVGMDISKNMLTLAKENISSNLKKKSKLENIDCELFLEKYESYFDIIIITYALSGSANPRKIFSNIKKYLKTGGILAILDTKTFFSRKKSIAILGFFLSPLMNRYMGGSNKNLNLWKDIWAKRNEFKLVDSSIYEKKVYEEGIESWDRSLIFQKLK